MSSLFKYDAMCASRTSNKHDLQAKTILKVIFDTRMYPPVIEFAPHSVRKHSFFFNPTGKSTLIFSLHIAQTSSETSANAEGKSRNLVAKYDNKLGQTSTRRGTSAEKLIGK